VLTALARQYLVPLLERYGVQVVFNGHEHSYQRSHPIRNGAIVESNRGTVYVTTGGGGHGTYPVFPNPAIARAESVFHYLRVRVDEVRVSIEAVNIDGAVFDTVEVAPLPDYSAASVSSVNAEPGRYAPGGVVSIFGYSLARGRGDVELAAQGAPCTVLYASPTQINAVLPSNLEPGEATLRLRNSNGETMVALPLSRTAPAVLAVAHADGSLVSAEIPAAASELLTLYGAGLGTPPKSTGAVALLSQPVVVQCASQMVTPEFAGAVAGQPGLYRIEFRLPASVAGSVVIRLMTGDASSPPTSIPVR
jgi:uncharacterized protein (TIGR03437 family)